MTNMKLKRKLIVAATVASLAGQPMPRLLATPMAEGPAAGWTPEPARSQRGVILEKVEPVAGTTILRAVTEDSVFEIEMGKHLKEAGLDRFPNDTRVLSLGGPPAFTVNGDRYWGVAIVMPSASKAFIAKWDPGYMPTYPLAIEMVSPPVWNAETHEPIGIITPTNSWIYLGKDCIVRAQGLEWSDKFGIKTILEKEGVTSLEGARLDWVPATHGTADMVRISAAGNDGMKKTFGIMFERWDGGREAGDGWLRDIKTVEAPAGKTYLEVTARRGLHGWRTYKVSLRDELLACKLGVFPPNTEIIHYASRGGHKYVILAPGAEGVIKVGIEQTGATRNFKGSVEPYCEIELLPTRDRVRGDERYLVDSEENLFLSVGRQLVFMEWVSFNTSVYELDSLAGGKGARDPSAIKWDPSAIKMRLLPADTTHTLRRAHVQIDLPPGFGMEHAYMPVYCRDCGQKK